MIPQDVDTHEVDTSNGPCLTAAVALNSPAEIEVRIRNAIRGLQKKLAERAIERAFPPG